MNKLLLPIFFLILSSSIQGMEKNHKQITKAYVQSISINPKTETTIHLGQEFAINHYLYGVDLVEKCQPETVWGPEECWKVLETKWELKNEVPEGLLLEKEGSIPLMSYYLRNHANPDETIEMQSWIFKATKPGIYKLYFVGPDNWYENWPWTSHKSYTITVL